MRWGILATGSIARTFAQQLSTSATGELVAVGSRTLAGARAFGAPRAHGSYEALLADRDVEAVYVATPHPLHAEWAIRAAEAGKHVLCEKPFTMSAAEAEAVVRASQANDVFLMEAFMYRCHPQTVRLRELLAAGTIGEVRVIEAVHSFLAPPERLDPEGRLLSPALGGGAILDVGCYCVSGALLVAGEEPVSVTGAGHIGPTGVDEWAVASLGFATGVVATLSCGIAVHQPPMLRLSGSTGSITLRAPWLPGRESVIVVDRPGAPSETIEVVATRGLYAYEADEVARCVAAGLRESPAMPLAGTVAATRVLDAWRAAVAG